MLVYEKKVEGERHIFGTLANIPSDDDVQLTYKDAEGSSVSPTLEDKYFDDGKGGIKMVSESDGTTTETELNVFIGDEQIIPAPKEIEPEPDPDSDVDPDDENKPVVDEEPKEP